MKMPSLIAGLMAATMFKQNLTLPQPNSKKLRERSARGHRKVAKRRELVISDDLQRALNKMTGWQRNQAMKHFKGNLQRVTAEQLQLFADMPHWKRVA